jgi:hypothetical protein
VLIDLRHVALWPLRSVGLDPGRALANARPSADEREAQRHEQWRYVQERVARGRRPA